MFVVKLGPVQVLERWSATENVTEALKSCKKKGWSARVLELKKKTSWSAGKKIGWSVGALILNCLERCYPWMGPKAQ